MGNLKFKIGTESVFNNLTVADGALYLVKESSASDKGYLYYGNGSVKMNIIPKLLDVANGGTGITVTPSLLIDLESDNATGVYAAAPRPGVMGTLPVKRGGTGATNFTTGYALIGNGENGITTRAITNNTNAIYISATPYLITANTLAYWTGAYNSSNSSRLAYCNKGAFGTAATKAYTDRTSAAAISSTGTTLLTERAIYYGLPTINGVHTYTSGTNIYPPTAMGTSGQILTSTGDATPTWKDPLSISWTAGTSAGPTLNVTVAGTTKTATIPSAGSSASGVVTTGTQTFAGAKTFNSALTGKSTLSISGASSLGGTLGVTGATTLKSTLGVSGKTSLGGALDVTGITKLYNKLDMSEAGDVVYSGATVSYNSSTNTITFAFNS